MSLTAGTRIGPYDVVSLLGVGGMGEVYRATDTQLKRAVAIKVLPAAFAGDADRLARFQREAQVLAALSHPNIAAIYGLEKTTDFTALVMELVEGEDLSALIARQGQTAPAAAGPSESASRGTTARESLQPVSPGVGPRRSEGSRAPRALNIEDALPIARQIAEALEAAHEQGIIHRDLKPANIKVRQDGTVKVLDFGLAKAMDPAGASTADAMNSPTLTVRATQMGMILGTAAYMAPEQARGKVVDERADIWAFGVVLYEMLSGRRAFEGEDISTTLASVLKEDVRWDALPKDLPASLSKLIRRCLERDPKQRLQAIGEARIAIDEVLAGGPAAESSPVQPAATPRPLTWIAATAVLAVLLLGSLTIAVSHLRETPPVPATVAFDMAPPEAIGELRSYDAPVVSPDGRYVAIPGPNGLSVRAIGSTRAVRLEGIGFVASPFWSPDSRTIAFFENTLGITSILKRVPVAGGAPDAGVSLPWNSYYGAWGPDGTIIVVGQGRLHRIPPGGGMPTPLWPMDTARGETSQASPCFLPDGRHLMYVSVAADQNNSTVRVRALDSNETTDLMTGVRDASYAQTADGVGRLLFVRGGQLWAQALDTRSLRLSGEPVRIAEAVENRLPLTAAAFSGSTNGVLAYRVTGPPERSQLTWYDRTGKTLGTVGDPAIYSNPALSPDDRWLAVSKADERVGTRDIWIIDLVRKAASRLTLGDVDDMNPVWSPDGREVAYSSGSSSRDIFRRLASGVGEPKLVVKSSMQSNMEDWSLDGRDLLYNVNSAAIWRASPSGDGTPAVLSKSKVRQDQAQLSPDGRWMAYRETGGEGAADVYVQTFPPSENRWQISTAGGQQPRWRRDGRELFYVAGDQIMAVSITVRNNAVEAGAPQPLLKGVFERTIRRNYYVVSADGQRFLLVQALRSTAPPRMTAVVNWTAPPNK